MFENTLNIFNEIFELSKTKELENDLNLKLTHLCALAENRLKNPYAILFDDNKANSLAAVANNILTPLKNHIASPNQSYLNTIKTNIVGAAGILVQMPDIGKDETQISLNKIIETFKQNNAEIIKNINETKNSFKAAVAKLEDVTKELSAKLTNEQAKIDSLSSAFQGQFSAAQDKRMNDFNEQQNKISEKAQNTLENINTNYDASLEQFNEDTKKIKEKLEIDFQNSIDEHNNKSKELFKQIEDIKIQSEEIKNEIEKLFGIVSGNALMGSQQKYANKAQKSAQSLFSAAIFSMLLAIFVAILVFQNVIFGEQQILDWKFLTFRFSFVILCLFPALYCMNESRKQKNQEYKFRDLEVKMEALPAYFHSLSDCPEVLTTRLILAEKILSPDKTEPDNEKENASFDNLKKLIDLFNNIKS